MKSVSLKTEKFELIMRNLSIYRVKCKFRVRLLATVIYQFSFESDKYRCENILNRVILSDKRRDRTEFEQGERLWKTHMG